jgi:hypothetical protein
MASVPVTVDELRSVLASGPLSIPPDRREIVLAALDGFRLAVERFGNLVLDEMKKFGGRQVHDIPAYNPTSRELEMRASLRTLDEMHRAVTSGEVMP